MAPRTDDTLSQSTKAMLLIRCLRIQIPNMFLAISHLLIFLFFFFGKKNVIFYIVIPSMESPASIENIAKLVVLVDPSEWATKNYNNANAFFLYEFRDLHECLLATNKVEIPFTC